MTIAEPLVDTDRRTGVRADVGGAVFCWRGTSPGASLGVALRAESLDVSRAGVRLRMPRAVGVGEALELEFLSPDGDRAAHRGRATVRWLRADGPGSWQVGCQFDEPMSLKALVALLR